MPSKDARPRPRLPEPLTAAVWERAWQRHWRKVGLPGYELPAGGDSEFLGQVRSPEKERARLKRINDEFVRAFRRLCHAGPAVTVFGSARFKPNHTYYKLAREVGSELAKAGFATLARRPRHARRVVRGRHPRPVPEDRALSADPHGREVLEGHARVGPVHDGRGCLLS